MHRAGLGAFFRPIDVLPLGITEPTLRRLVRLGQVEKVAQMIPPLQPPSPKRLAAEPPICLAIPSAMIASNIYVPLYSSPMVWALIGLAVAVEVLADRTLLRWLQHETRGVIGRLLLIQITTWCAVVAFLDRLGSHNKDLSWSGVVVITLIVAVVEFALLRIAVSIPREGFPAARLRISTAMALSAVGNVVGFGFFIGAVALQRLLS